MSLCEEILISEYVEVPEKSCYVFANIDPSNSNSWKFSCNCGYNNEALHWLPNYLSMRRKLFCWFDEYNCRKLDKSICNHIKIAFAAKTIVNLFQNNNSIEPPRWAKNFLGKDYLKKATEIFKDLSPISLGNQNNERYGMGRVKMYDYIYYHVQLKYPTKWTCTCNDYKFFDNCLHISKIQILEKYLQNRRELCISLASKYILENT